MITSLLEVIQRVYIEMYPKRNIGLINFHTCERQLLADKTWVKTPLDDTGICFGIAMFVQDYLRLHGVTVEMVYLYRHYNAPGGDGYEDTLVHAVLLCDGKYYDARDCYGVDDINALHFIQTCDGLDTHYAVYPERGDTGSRDTIPNHITPALYAALEKTLHCTIPRRSIT